ncbi:hypothetical protein QFZ28_004011 [Neobacillus niacini]|uniref:DUF1796 family putative cysteine peptidase n=1 Tax=Neobacillus niacini TaxID=86668 RepID=UPI00277DCD5B|nr:DUF1796 family putative cysteine peptidase [Neobacillus niacini]MDQ1003611.1 hypothetical protein [Neobacillus niacini]
MGNLKLKDIKIPYDVIVSLGSWCGVATELKKHQLRKFSGPFDWVTTPSLLDINRLLKTRFQSYMDIKNMKYVNKSKFVITNDDDQETVTERETYIIQDTMNNIASYHDFPVIPNQSWEMFYPSFKVTLNRRINRFYERISKSQMSLFVRYNASYQEVAELSQILKGLTDGKYHILVVNPVEGLPALREENWDLDRAVCVSIPFVRSDKTQWNSQDWDIILNGVIVTK